MDNLFTDFLKMQLNSERGDKQGVVALPSAKSQEGLDSRRWPVRAYVNVDPGKIFRLHNLQIHSSGEVMLRFSKQNQ